MRPMTRKIALILFCSMAFAGCSGSGLSTGSIFGGAKATNTAAVAPAPDPNGDPTMRALQVGSTSARAVKCGYNFDPAKLKAAFLAHELGRGADAASAARMEQIYDVAYNGVTKASAGEAKYCTPDKTAEIKAALTRHLAGDYSPNFKKKAEPEDSGMFSGFWGGGSSTGSDKDVAIDQRTIQGDF